MLYSKVNNFVHFCVFGMNETLSKAKNCGKNYQMDGMNKSSVLIAVSIDINRTCDG